MSRTTLRRGVQHKEVTNKPGYFPPLPAKNNGFGTTVFKGPQQTTSGAAGPAMTSKAFEQRQTARRNLEYQTNNLLGYHQEKARIQSVMESDQRVDTMRRMKRLQENNSELAFSAQLEANAKADAQRRTLTEQDAKLAQTLSELKANKVSKESNEKRICDESDELQALKLKLNAAHLNKARATQMEEKTYIAAQQKELDSLLEQRMAADRATAEAQLFEQKQKELFDNMERRKMLRAQVDHKQKERQAAYEAFLAEKAQVDAVVAGLAEEDNKKRENALKRKHELQANIQQYLEERRLWRDGERKRAEAELRKIQEYNALQQARYADLLAKKKQNVDLQAKMLARVTEEIEQKKREEDEMRMLLDELYQEEAESKALAALQAEQAKRDKIKHDMVAANDFQKLIKHQRAIDRQQEEAEFRQRMLSKFESDSRLESMNAARRKREIANYRAAVEQMIEDRRSQYESVRAAEAAEAIAKAQEDAYKKSVIEKERQRLLAEHASNLKEHLPKGVILNADDYRLVHGPNAPLPPQMAAAAAGGRVQKNYGKKYDVYVM